MEDEGSFKSLSASFVFEEDENEDDGDEISDVEAGAQPNQELVEKRGKKRQRAGYDDFYGEDEYSPDVETFSSRKKSSKAFSVKPKLRFCLKSMKSNNPQAAKSDKSSKLETQRLKEPESLKDFKGSWKRVSRDEVSGDCIDSDNETDPELQDNTDMISSKVPPLDAEEPTSISDDGHLAGEATKFGFCAQLKESLQEKGQCLNFKDEASEASDCLDLRIIEEWVEAHLITCRCEILHSPENSSSLSCVDGAQKGLVTAMFDTTARTCLDLLVGRVVRIHPPWRELEQVKGHGRVILCTYNSEMVSQKIDGSA